MWTLAFLGGLALIIALGWWLPRFSVYFLGPLVLVSGAGLFIRAHKLFFPFQSGGSPAGMIVPAIMWLALLVTASVGVSLIAMGRKRIRQQVTPGRRTT